MTNTHLYIDNISGPLLVFGGPYSNLPATQAMKQVAEELGIPPEHCICTGDIVAYCAQASETVDFIRDWGVHCLMGNCEESFANNSDDCGCGFEEGTSCDLLSAQWFHLANQQLNTSQRQWFASLPRSIKLRLGSRKVQVVHGSVSSINQFIFASSNEAIFQEELSLSDADMVIGGHCGIPFTKTLGNKIWHNAGAIGMPANDGTTRTWFSIIEVNNDQLDIRIQALEYDYSRAHQAMLTAEMNNGYAQALQTGLWPSMDVLPIAERRQRGQAIHHT